MVAMVQKPGQLYRAIGATGALADQARPAIAARRMVLPEVVDQPKLARFIWLCFTSLSLSAIIEYWLRGEIGVITGSVGIGLVFIGRGMLEKADLAYLVATPPAAFLVAVLLPNLIPISRSANPLNQLSATVLTHLANLAPFVLISFGISYLLYKVAYRN
jgi:uncharacterized membrane protein